MDWMIITTIAIAGVGVLFGMVRWAVSNITNQIKDSSREFHELNRTLQVHIVQTERRLTALETTNKVQAAQIRAIDATG
jgi:hypothetical protein